MEVKSEKLKVKNDGMWYDLNGRKLNAPQKGINIVGGKKILIK